MTEVIDLPHGYPNNVIATRLANAFYNKFKPKEFDDVKVLWFHSQGPVLVHTKSKPIHKLEDLKGLKMRTYGSNAKLMAYLGGAPVAMPIPTHLRCPLQRRSRRPYVLLRGPRRLQDGRADKILHGELRDVIHGLLRSGNEQKQVEFPFPGRQKAID